jgi:hypothetical protein|nr:hypothetical protein [uncultured Noviherbaspirillum sp.]
MKPRKLNQRLHERVRQFWRLAMPFWMFRDAEHGTTEQRIANYRYNRAQRNVLPFYMAKWLGISICLLKMTEVLSGLMLSTQARAHSEDHLFAALFCMSAGIAFAFSCIVLLMLATSYVYLSCVER